MTVEELKASYPEISFIKTSHLIQKPIKKLLEEAFIPDNDMKTFPELKEESKVFPLSVQSYPSLLKRLTAMEAGALAMTKCKEHDWAYNFDNFQCALTALEISSY